MDSDQRHDVTQVVVAARRKFELNELLEREYTRVLDRCTRLRRVRKRNRSGPSRAGEPPCDENVLVNGTLAKSWEGLPRDVVIVNWNHGGAAKSLPFFSARGHRQLLAGYYDSAPEAIAKWLQTAGTNSNVAGVMYTTWRDKYDDLEKFARHAWGKVPK